jgi:hypothetical protein
MNPLNASNSLDYAFHVRRQIHFARLKLSHCCQPHGNYGVCTEIWSINLAIGHDLCNNLQNKKLQLRSSGTHRGEISIIKLRGRRLLPYICKYGPDFHLYVDFRRNARAGESFCRTNATGFSPVPEDLRGEIESPLYLMST